MRLGSKALFIGAFLAFYSSFAAALGLGEIKLNSSLNQPLDAEIKLQHVRDLAAADLIVSLASDDEFKHAGVERSYFLHELTFKVDLDAANGPVIRVHSNSPIREPFINFLIVAQWPSGKLVREFTLLLDLPVFAGTPAAPVTAAKREKSSESPKAVAKPKETVRPAAAVTPPVNDATEPSLGSESSAAEPSAEPEPSKPSTAPSKRSSSISGGDYGPVGANDTLWAIASKVRPSSTSVYQTMVALQQANPQAFINGNINLLRRGQVLRIPDEAAVQAISQRDAVNAVAEQNRQWSQKSAAPSKAETNQPEETAPQLEGSKTFSRTRSESTTPEGRVKLSSPSTGDASKAEGTGTEGKANRKGALTSVLSTKQEELDAANRENADLKSRMSSVEEQIETMEKLVQVSNAELNALESAAKKANEPAPTEQAPVVKEKPVTAPAKAEGAEKSLVDLVMENIIYVAAGVGLLIAVIAFVIYMRGRDDGMSSDLDNDFKFDFNDDESKSTDSSFAESSDSFQSDHLARDSERDDLGAKHFSEAETEDVAGECDIHIAYGQYREAEEKLVRALEQEPDNIALRLKLLEVFAVTSDLANFDLHFAKIYKIADHETIDRANMLREGFDNAEPFNFAAYDQSSDLTTSEKSVATADDEFNYDDESTDNRGDIKDDTLDFDLGNVDNLTDSDDSKSVENDLELSLGDLESSLLSDDDTYLESDSSSTNLAGLDLDLGSLDGGENSAKKATTTDGDLSGELGDLDFDLDDSDTDFSFEDIELSLDEPEAMSAMELDDSAPIKASEKSQFDVEELASSSLDMGSEQNDFDLDRAILDLDMPNLAEQEVSSESTAEDLDLEIENALNDLDDSMLDEPAESLVEAQKEEVTDDLDLDSSDLIGEMDSDYLDTDNSDLSASESVATAAPKKSLLIEDEFDSSLDLDANMDFGDIDSLDKELDSLTSDFEGSVDLDADDSLGSDADTSYAATEALMDEPITDFGDMSSLDADDSTELSAADLAVPASAPISTMTELTSADELADSREFDIPDFDPENDDDSNLDFLSDNDETATKLDLARAYIDMGDTDGAKDILDEIVEEGNAQQKQEASQMLARLA